MKKKIALTVILLTLFYLLSVPVFAEEMVTAEEIAGEWSGTAILENSTIVSEDYYALDTVQVTLLIKKDGSGTYSLDPDTSGPLTYREGVISGSLAYTVFQGEVPLPVAVNNSFGGTVSRQGNDVTIDGHIVNSTADGKASYSWRVTKEIPRLAGETKKEEDEIPVLIGPEEEGDMPSFMELVEEGERLEDFESAGEPKYDWDWSDCDCEDEPWEKHAGPLVSVAISVAAAVAAALGGFLGSGGGAVGGALAEALGSVSFESDALAEAPGSAGLETGSSEGADPSHEREEPAEEGEEEGELTDDYILPPEAGFGGPADNPYTSFLDGKGPGDCVKYGLPRYWVNTASLNLVIGDTFFEGQGLGPKINLTLNYNSASDRSGIFGRGWSFSYEGFLEQKGYRIWVHKGSGQSLPFTTAADAAGGSPEQPVEALPPAGIHHRLLDYGQYWLYIEKGSPVFQRFDRVSGMSSGRLTAINDYYGNKVTLSYSSRGNLKTITDAAGRSIRFTFNEKNLCTGLVLADGRQASFSYDGDGRLIYTEDLMGIPVKYQYDAGSSLTKMITGKSERTVTFTYEEKGGKKLLHSFSDPNGNVTRYRLLSTSPYQVEVTDPEENRIIFQSRGGLTEAVTDPLGQTATVEYRHGLPVNHRDRNGGLICWEYDGAGNQVKEIDQTGEELLFEYDSFGNLTEITDPLGGKWMYRYNDGHSLVGITSPAGRRLAIDYNEKGLPASLTGFDGLRTTMDYDHFGNLVRVSGPAGGITTFTFDEGGYLPTAVTDALGYSAAFEYDANGRQTWHRHPDGSEKKLVFDCCYSLLATDERGFSRGYERDANGNILKEIDASLATGELAYDGNNNLVSLLDSRRQLTRYSYDGARRLSQVTNALGQNQLFSYDPAGNLLSYQMEGGQPTSFKYDLCHRKIGITDPLGANTVLKRDALGRVIEELDARGKRVEFKYDPDGLLEKVLHDGEETARYAYDNGGRLSEILDASGKVSYAYDEAGGFKAITYHDGSVLSISSNKAGLVESITYPGGLMVSYRYDSRMRPAEMSWSGGWVKYSYDPAGNLVKEERSNGTESIYEYDKDGRLIGLKHSLEGESFTERRYRRDPFGSILEEEGTQPLISPLDQELTLSCNPADQMAAPFRYDEAGNLLEGPGWQAAYDGESRLVELSREGLEKRFHYNGLGYLVRVDMGEDSLEYGRDPRGNLMFESRAGAKPNRFYLYCHSRPAAIFDEEDGIRFYHYDQGGNTLALTGSDGSLAVSYAYSPFGLSLSSGDTSGNPFTFCGAYGVMDEGEGLYFMKRRFYSAHWGRFLQKDPLGFEGGNNPYVYAANNPLFYIDPDGTVLLGAWVAWKTVGVAVGVATSVYYTYKTVKSSHKTASETKKSAQAMEKMNKAYDDYSKICDKHGQFGGWDAKEAAWQKYVNACHEFNAHKNAACQGAVETVDNLTELGKNVATPDAVSLPVSIYDHAHKGGGNVFDPCQGGRPVTATKGIIWQPKRHY